ncbi:MAG: phage tail protein, partial [Mediterranea sp.]|nr:phage tail protein [Mediterranea sp.]
MAATDWNPVLFYFEVKFEIEGQEHVAPFLEVNGLNQKLVLEEQAQQGDNVVPLPTQVKFNDIVLKRPLQKLTDPISQWAKECFDFPLTCQVKPARLLISLLDGSGKEGERGAPLATWECNRTILVEWSLDTLKADESKLAVETLTLRPNNLQRKQ